MHLLVQYLPLRKETILEKSTLNKHISSRTQYSERTYLHTGADSGIWGGRSIVCLLYVTGVTCSIPLSDLPLPLAGLSSATFGLA